MSSSVFKIDSSSSNSLSINDIPIASGVPSNGSLLTYNSTTNQWVVTPREYIHVSSSTFQIFNETGTFPLTYDIIIEDKTQKNIIYNITNSTWTLQPGTYRFSVYCPNIYIEALTTGSADKYVSTYVSYTSIATGVQTDLKNNGAMWRANNDQTTGSFVYTGLFSLTALVVTEPVIANITFYTEIDPVNSSEIYIGNGTTDTGYASVLVEQIE